MKRENWQIVFERVQKKRRQCSASFALADGMVQQVRCVLFLGHAHGRPAGLGAGEPSLAQAWRNAGLGSLDLPPSGAAAGLAVLLAVVEELRFQGQGKQGRQGALVGAYGLLGRHGPEEGEGTAGCGKGAWQRAWADRRGGASLGQGPAGSGKGAYLPLPQLEQGRIRRLES